MDDSPISDSLPEMREDTMVNKMFATSFITVKWKISYNTGFHVWISIFMEKMKERLNFAFLI